MPKISYSTALITDAEGASHRLAIIGCLNCKGLIVALDQLKPLHLNRAEAELLIESCRIGQASPLAKPGVLMPDTKVITQTTTLGGKWLLFFQPDDVVKFMCSGIGSAEPSSGRLAMTRKHLEEFGGLLFETMTRSAPPEARA